MWECAIEGCGHRADAAAELLVHQATGHEPVRCEVCGARIPDGYFAIRHVFDEHNRAEYVRAYDADAEGIRHRQSIREEIETAVDVEAVVERVNGNDG
ncbi:hypothetical protein BRC93_03785 [Halobacteriales archaeon QS_5_70_15]|jgi:hypothetical protein|nr:MAG: hypothetical protein BRC93_03785 [Halobacteriales archaeon QS_5_70_15]